jgi:hypothetical protein
MRVNDAIDNTTQRYVTTTTISKLLLNGAQLVFAEH